MHRPPPVPPARPSERTRTPIEAHALVFTGRGGEYFRVWIVNVLLMIVTLALYTPVARLRTARYFFSHTLVAGTPLEFSASAWRMFKGFLIFALLYLLLELAEYANQQLLAALLMLGATLLWPFFWGSAMRFRLRATRWRGVRMAFTARWGEVYAASWPLFCLAGAWVALLLLIWWLNPMGDGAESRPPPQVQLTMLIMFRMQWQWVLVAGLALGALALWCLAMQEFNYRRLLVRRTRIGQQMGYWPRVRASAFVRIWFISGLLAVASVVVATAASWAVMVLIAFNGLPAALMLWLVLVFATVGMVAFFLISTPALAYHEACVFRMVWNEVGLGPVARVRCSLSVRGYVWLRIRNSLLSVATMGFYRPFARVAEYQYRLESVTLYVKGGLEQLEGRLVQEQGALGDAFADGLGLDII